MKFGITGNTTFQGFLKLATMEISKRGWIAMKRYTTCVVPTKTLYVGWFSEYKYLN